MPSRRDLRLDMYGIGHNEYRELYYHCLRYPNMLRRLADLRCPYTSPQFGGGPRGTNVAALTEDAATRAAELAAECEMIEQAAIAAGGQHYKPLLNAVTHDRAEWQVDIPVSRDRFRAMRHKFYYLLARAKKII